MCALALLAATLALPAAGQSMFRADVTHSGVAAGSAPLQFHRVKWIFPTGLRIVSSPTWHDGAIVFGSDDGHFYAIVALAGLEPAAG